MSMKINTCIPAVFLSVFGKLPVPSHLGKNEDFFHYIWEKLHKIWKNKAIFGLGMPPITGGKTGQIKSLTWHDKHEMTYLKLHPFC